MNKDLCFSFYSVIKNEDAEPYVGNSFIAVADGVGGRGGMLHTIDREKHKNVQEDLVNSAFGDFDFEKASTIEDYIEELIQPILEDSPKTSALWASRIIISRCVYALLCDEKFANGDLSSEELRAELADFIEKSLKDVKEEFDLKKGDFEDQQILPSTLCAIRFKEEDDKVIAESIWAGDSRCCALTKDGLIPLSVDEEDGTGVMTNKFYYDYEASLRYSRVSLDKPCVLMTISDGIFDPYIPHDNFGVENVFLSKILSSSSVEELRESLYQHYVATRGDDATVAFVSFGFDSYDHMRSYFKERGEFIEKAYSDYSLNKNELKLMAATTDTYTPYVKTRTSDKYPFIVGKLIELLSSNTDDILATGLIKSIYEGIIEGHRKELEKALNEGKSNVLNQLKAIIQDESTDIVSFISDDKLSSLLLTSSGADKSVLSDLLKSLKSYLADARGFDSKKQALQNKRADYNDVLQLLYDEINSVRAEIDSARNELDEIHENEREASISTSKKERSKIGSYIREYCDKVNKLIAKEAMLYDIELTVAVKETELSKEDSAKYKSSFKKIEQLINRLRAYKEARSTVIGAETVIKKSSDKLKRNVEAFIDYCINNSKILDVYDNKYSTELALSSFADNIEFAIDDRILSEIKNAFMESKEQVVEYIVSTFIENCSESSCLDFIYDRKRFANFKEYHKYKTPSEELLILKSTLDEIWAKYEEYLSKI